MSSENEISKLKKEKIILQAKLKQKEDKITELNKKVRELSINSKEVAPSKDDSNKIDSLEDELKRSRKVNKDLRAENSSLLQQIEDLKKIKASGSAIEKVSDSQPAAEGINPEEFEFMNADLAKKDEIIARLVEQLDMFKPENYEQVGTSYMKTRKLNAKIRELKSQVELAKKSEASMKERLMEMQRKMSLRDENLSW